VLHALCDALQRRTGSRASVLLTWPCDHPGVVAIREFELGDGEPLRALWTDSGFRLIGDDDAGLARFAARNPGLFLVADDDAQAVGPAMGAWDGRRGWLYHVAVSAGHRRQGLASRLVAMLEDRLRELGCPRAVVIVEAANDDAMRFWTATGYERRDTFQLGKSL
jgi:ribosomal protein S18 acetylase RimI-like enzyme